MSEELHDPAKQRDIVEDNAVARVNNGQTCAFGTLADVVVCDSGAATVGLADGDFQPQDGDSEEEKSHQIGYEPLRTMIVENLAWVSEDVTQTDSTTH